jgi:C-terminal processing protease CtpA/Prc
MLRARAFGDAPVGELGFELAHERGGSQARVGSIDPDGPAATSGLVVGDVIATVDGIAVTGIDRDNFEPAVTAPPGTRIVLGLARGASVTIALGVPAP